MTSEYYEAFACKCPRCDAEYKSSDFICNNCKKGTLEAANNTYRGSYGYTDANNNFVKLYGDKGRKSFKFRCKNCRIEYSSLNCKCGAEIQPEQINLEITLIDILIVLAFFIGIIWLAMHFFSGMKPNTQRYKAASHDSLVNYGLNMAAVAKPQVNVAKEWEYKLKATTTPQDLKSAVKNFQSKHPADFKQIVAQIKKDKYYGNALKVLESEKYSDDTGRNLGQFLRSTAYELTVPQVIAMLDSRKAH